MTYGSNKAPIFGKRKEHHTIIIAKGDVIRHFTIRPWVVALASTCIVAATVGYIGATSYLVMRDGLITGSVARQARVQQAYEDRISALRTQVDRITSRQMLDQQIVENKVSELLDRQNRLATRQGRLGPILERVKGLKGANNILKGAINIPPIPTPRPSNDAKQAFDSIIKRGDTNAAPVQAAAYWPTEKSARGSFPAEGKFTTADQADALFVAVNQSLRDIESEQVAYIKNLATNAQVSADRIATVLDKAGVRTAAIAKPSTGTGGPLVPATQEKIFEYQVNELDAALQRLNKLKSAARSYPFANPLPGAQISSRFGYRRDPFLRSPALHSGLDFRAPSGTKVRATAYGTVIRAGWRGGYGRMVEIKHKGGLTTRYAHLSKISVSVGQKVRLGTFIGRVGSSGRSTGPHLHYEVRRKGKATNPIGFIKVGKKIKDIL